MGRRLQTLLSLCCFVVAAPLHSQTETLGVVEDSWIHGLQGTQNHGADAVLRVCPACYQWTYLKFDLAGITGVVADAELRLRRIGGSRPQEISLYFIVDDTWTEADLVGLNRPEPRTPAPEDALAVGEDDGVHDRWASSAFTEIVQTELEGDGVLSLMVREDYNAVVDLRTYYSREGASTAAQMPHLLLTLAESTTHFNRGDTNGDSELDVSDSIFLLLFLFAGGAALPCADAGDANDDGSLDTADAVTILGYLFRGDAPLEQPFGDCGLDPTGDPLSCRLSDICP